MLQRFRHAGLIWPTLLALPALALLVSLGTWQMQRKAWKDGLLAQIHANVSAPPRELTPGMPLEEYRRVRVRGRFRHQDERYFFAPDQQLGPGFHVYTPMILEDGRVLIVNRGFVPDRLKSPASRPESQPSGTMEVVGLLRGPGEKGTFSPDNDGVRNLWFWRDLEGMAGCRPATGRSVPAFCGKLLPFFLDAGAEPANPGGWPRGGTTIVDLPNRHLEYAVTWYGLALTLVGVFVAFAAGRLKQAA